MINQEESINKTLILNDVNFSQQLRISSSKSQKSIRLNSASSNKVKKFEENESLILDLPTEIICLIMSFLNLNDRKNASLVSKKWRGAFEEGFMLKDIVVRGNTNLIQQSVKEKEEKPSISETDRTLFEKAINLEFKNDIRLDHFQIENKLVLNNLKCLILNSCVNLNSKILFNLLKISNNIEILHLIQCDTLFMNGFSIESSLQTLKLENLNELSLSKNRYLNDKIFNLFLNMAPNLKKLDLSYCFLTKTQFQSLGQLEQQKQESLSLNLNSAVFTFENMCKLIELHANKIKSLNLTGIDLLNKEENILKLLHNIENLNLTELIIENLSTLKIRTICKILNKQNKLTRLNMNNSMQVQDTEYYRSNNNTNNGFESIFTELFDNKNGANELVDTLIELKLKKLYLNSNCYIMFDISKLSNLIHLDLSYCTFNTSFTNRKQLNIYIKQFANNLNKLVLLETLILGYCGFLVNDYVIQKLCLKVNKLKHLDVRNCNKISDKAIHFIAKYLVNLEYLDLSWCPKITDYAFNKNINEILLKYETSFEKHTSFGYCKCPMCVKMLTNGIHSNRNVLNTDEDDDLKDYLVDFDDPELNEISIENDISMRNLKKLRVLKLESCNNISDTGLENGINFAQLNELDIKLCTNIIGNFKFNENLNLKILNINQCINFKYENLIEILKHAKYLKQLYTSASPAMNNNIIDFLRNNKIVLSNLDVSYCTNVNEYNMDLYEQFLYNEYASKDFFIDKRFISRS